MIKDDLVSNKEIPYTIANNTEHLFSIIPKYVIKKNSVAKAIRLMKEHKWSNPLFYKKERNVRHWVFSILAYLNQIRKFKKFYK